MIEFMKILLVLLIVASASGCTTANAKGEWIEYPIPKRFYARHEDPFFQDKLRLPVEVEGGDLVIPRSFDDAVEQLRVGIDTEILDMAGGALNNACGHQEKCNYASFEVWGRFIAETESLEVERGRTLASYFSEVSVFLGAAWHLGRDCPGRAASVCEEISSIGDAAPEILALVIIRAGVAKHRGVPGDVHALLEGMGDLVAPRSVP